MDFYQFENDMNEFFFLFGLKKPHSLYENIFFTLIKISYVNCF